MREAEVSDPPGLAGKRDGQLGVARCIVPESEAILGLSQIPEAEASMPDRHARTEPASSRRQVGRCRLEVFLDDPDHSAGHQGIGLAERNLADAGRHGVERSERFLAALAVRERQREGAGRVRPVQGVGASPADRALAPGNRLAQPS